MDEELKLKLCGEETLVASITRVSQEISEASRIKAQPVLELRHASQPFFLENGTDNGTCFDEICIEEGVSEGKLLSYTTAFWAREVPRSVYLDLVANCGKSIGETAVKLKAQHNWLLMPLRLS